MSACIDKISATVARLPVKMYRKENGRISEIIDDNRLVLLNGETGDTLTTVDLWRSVIEDYYLGGGVWIYINSDGIRTKSLHYVDSRNVSITTNNDHIFRTFRIFVNGTEYYDFQFIRLFRKTRTGYSNIPLQDDNPRILSAAYNALKLEVQMNRTGGNKRGFLKAKTKLTQEALDKIKSGFSSIYGNDNTGRIPVLNDGIDFQPLSSTAVELQMNENKRINSQEICKLFGFPHTVIDGNASDDDNKKFTETIVSLLNQIETALDAFLLLETEKDKGFYFAFDTKELTRGSLRERYEAYQIAVKNHILQVDEIRREEDFEPLGFNFVTMGLGDVLLNPKTMEVFTPNTGQTSKLGEQRAEIELRYNHNHDEKGRFCSGRGGGRFSSGNSAKSLDNSEKSDIINSDNRKMSAEQKAPDFSKYEVKEDLQAVEQIKKKISESLGIAEKDINLDGIKNADALEPLVNQFIKIQADTGMQFPPIKATEVIAGDTKCIASFMPYENKFYISSKYFNSKQALEDTLKDWSGNGILPKQAKSIRYLAEHESAHMRIPDEILQKPEALTIHKQFVKSKFVNDNDRNPIEFFADSVAVCRTSSKNVPPKMTEAVQYLKKEGIK